MSYVRCRGIRDGKKCGRKAGAVTKLCRACRERRNRGGFVSKTCRPWELKRLKKQTRKAAKEAFEQ